MSGPQTADDASQQMRGIAHREHFRAVGGDQNGYDIPFPYAVVTQCMNISKAERFSSAPEIT
ncbi:hypothetical protein [Streptomyces avermitilis]|uniref:hypothetical protein n=1 Tax=Streptomyces avermitilis TaxID=33903 RepID=UPI0033AEA191